MVRKVMDGGFRRLKKVPAAEPVDPRLALVDLFMNGQAEPQVGFIDLSSPPQEGAIELSGDEPGKRGVEEDAQEPGGERGAEDGADDPSARGTEGQEDAGQQGPARKQECTCRKRTV